MSTPTRTLDRAAERATAGDIRELLDATAELLDAAAFGDRAMAARERLARVARRIGLYPPRRAPENRPHPDVRSTEARP